MPDPLNRAGIFVPVGLTKGVPAKALCVLNRRRADAGNVTLRYH